MNINGKNIILTGASSGIGAALLKELLQFDNVRIIAVARHVETIPYKEGMVFPFSADLTNREGVDSLFAYAERTFGAIDIFIANAGFAYFEQMRQPDWEHIDAIFELNVFSVCYALEKFSVGVEDRKLLFICTISAVAFIPLPYYSLYCSTKAALHQFIETYRYEARKNLNIMAVYPVATHTSFFQKAYHSKKPVFPFLSQNSETVACSVIRGIKKDRKKVYPSCLFQVFNVFNRIFPFLGHFYSLNEKRKTYRRLD